MPVDRYRNLRFRTLNNCFRDVHRKYDIDDLVDACNEAVRRVYLDNSGVTKRTIQKDLQALQLPPYSIRLKENFRSGHKRLYRYEDPSFYLEVLTDQEKSQIEEAVKVIKSLPDNPQYRWVQTMLEQLQFGRNIADRSVIAFQYNPELKGIEHFSPLLDAIIHRQPLHIVYQPYGKDAIDFDVHPYLLKQFNDRWYFICQSEAFDSLSYFPIDRIISIEPWDAPYREPVHDVNKVFGSAIGISNLESGPQDIVLQVSKSRWSYIETKPIHSSQTLIETSDDWVTIGLRLVINKELVSLLLSYGDDLRIVTPDALKQQIIEKISNISAFYQNSEQNIHS